MIFVFCEWWPAALELLYHNSTIAPGTELQTLHFSNTRYRVADITLLQYQVQSSRHYTSSTPDRELQTLSHYQSCRPTPLRHQIHSCRHYSIPLQYQLQSFRHCTSTTPGRELHTLHLSDTRYRVAFTTPL
jgi:hypothetical protein